MISKAVLFGTVVSATIAVPARAAQGVVVYAKDHCHDRYVVSTRGGFTILEWMGGGTPAEHDLIAGNFEAYGMPTLQDVTSNSETRAWVEDYWLSKDTTIEKMAKFCEE